MPDAGVVFLMPHITPNLMKDIIEIGETNYQLTLKEKKEILLTPVNIEVLSN